ncbi:MAG: hypothetical protein IJU58_03075 [Clostridia bacterium]|nr:hypothetical protein [Clostridia bacterium]
MSKKLKMIIGLIVGFVVLCAACFSVYYYAIFLPGQKDAYIKLRPNNEYYNNKLIAYEEENPTLNDVDVAFIGDSLTDGYDLSLFYPQYNTINRGIAGDTTFGVEYRLKVSLYDINPKVVVMLIGGNNYKTMFQNYESILQKLQTNMPNSHVVLLSLTALGGDFSGLNNTFKQNNAVIQSLAQKYSFEYIDIFTPLYNNETGGIYDEYTTDSVHLTTQGYQVLTNAITPVLAELI